jgi:hypothetical protein
MIYSLVFRENSHITVGADAYHAARAEQLTNMQESPAKTYKCGEFAGDISNY